MGSHYGESRLDMSVPDYQQFMLPLLRILGDGLEHTVDEYVDQLAIQFGLRAEDRRELLPSGRQTKLRNRVGWAATYLSKAGLLTRTGRGRIRITDRGREVLSSDPDHVDSSYLDRFAEFAEFKQSTRNAARVDPSDNDNAPTSTADDSTLSPDEMLEASYQRLRESLAQNLLDRIKAAPPAFFEQLVVDLLVTMGYGGSRSDAGEAIGGSGDGGIDGIIKEDRLGLDFVYVQAKRWENVVGRPHVQGFAGSLEGQRARKGVFITTSTFTDNARQYVTNIEKRIVLIDGQELAELMLDYGIGVTEVATYRVQRVDLDYFGDE